MDEITLRQQTGIQLDVVKAITDIFEGQPSSNSGFEFFNQSVGALL